jgi:cbb3-type cytochrome oxidase maturation protein
MSVMYVALPIAIALGATALWACVRSIRSGQFDDLDTPPVRMLLDEHPLPETTQTDEGNDDA